MEPRYWWEYSDEKNKNKLAEWKVFVGTVGMKSADLKDNSLFWSFAALQAA